MTLSRVAWNETVPDDELLAEIRRIDSFTEVICASETAEEMQYWARFYLARELAEDMAAAMTEAR